MAAMSRDNRSSCRLHDVVAGHTSISAPSASQPPSRLSCSKCHILCAPNTRTWIQVHATSGAKMVQAHALASLTPQFLPMPRRQSMDTASRSRGASFEQ